MAAGSAAESTRVQNLSAAQRGWLAELAREETGGVDPCTARWARMLLLVDRGLGSAEVARRCGVKRITVWRLRKRVAERGLEAALVRSRGRKLEEGQRDYLAILVTAEPPMGRDRWTLRLLADTLVERGIVENISHVAVWHALRDGALHDS